MGWYRKSSAGLRVWLDDERDPSDSNTKQLFGSRGDEVWVKTSGQAIELLKTGKVNFISLDHDLGNRGDGQQVANWIEKNAFAGTLPRLEWRIHTKNVVRASPMRQALENADRFWDLEHGK